MALARLPAYKVDAFTSEPYGGNPAGVVLEGAALSSGQMQAIAREMNLSETAFVLPPTEAGRRAGASLRFRYFTPAAEVPLCGHATVATGRLLAALGKLKGAATVETLHGPIGLRVGGDGADPVVWFEVSRFEPAEPPDLRMLLPGLLGIPDDAILGVAAVDRKLLVELDGLAALGGSRPDFRGVLDVSAKDHLQGICIWTLETRDARRTMHVRYFAPAVGIDEDPVTGTANASLAAHLLAAGRLADLPNVDLRKGKGPGGADLFAYRVEQGHFCGRPGEVFVEAWRGKVGPVVRVGGHAVVALEGSIVVPRADLPEPERPPVGVSTEEIRRAETD